LPAYVHGLIDYAIGALLIAVPFLLGFDDTTATAVSIGLGLVLLIVAGATELPTGLVHSVPRALHAIIDYVVALALVAAPFVLGFAGEDETATPALVAIGVVQLMQTLATRFLRPKDERRPQG
jgi:hypothetical protein